jgi:hypothetical protein
VPTYRIFYAAREEGEKVTTMEGRPHYAYSESAPHRSGDQPIIATEWEELIEADSGPEALDSFFRERIRSNSELAWIDDTGQARTVEGLDYDPELSYIWVEDGKLMEFQGLDEATPGMVTCPLCNGHGEIDESLAEEFDEVWNEDEDAIDADVKG